MRLMNADGGSGAVARRYTAGLDAIRVWTFSRMISRLFLTIMARCFFLSDEMTPVQINGLGKITIKPFDNAYDFAPSHWGSLPCPSREARESWIGGIPGCVAPIRIRRRSAEDRRRRKLPAASLQPLKYMFTRIRWRMSKNENIIAQTLDEFAGHFPPAPAIN